MGRNLGTPRPGRADPDSPADSSTASCWASPPSTVAIDLLPATKSSASTPEEPHAPSFGIPALATGIAFAVLSLTLAAHEARWILR